MHAQAMHLARSACIAVVLAACGDPANHLTAEFARTKLCPENRVHVALVPDLAIEPIRVGPFVPWHEPDLPADIAADPERKRMWLERRDNDYDAWQWQQEEADPHTSQSAASSRAIPIYEATGCGMTELERCASRYSCTPITDAMSTAERLMCKAGGAPQVIDGHTVCAPGEPIADPNACAAACPHVRECNHGCSDDACKLACSAAEVHCTTSCWATSDDRCKAAGLDRLGLCASLSRARNLLADQDLRVAMVQADVAQRAADREVLSSATRTEQACTTRCRSVDDSASVVDCVFRCVTRARQECEQGAKDPGVWCKGLRLQEDAAQQARRMR